MDDFDSSSEFNSSLVGPRFDHGPGLGFFYTEEVAWHATHMDELIEQAIADHVYFESDDSFDY